MLGELMAALYDPLIAPLDPIGVGDWRKWVVGSARGHVLELGVGTGLNLPYYPAPTIIAAIDRDGASLQRARSRANGHRSSIELFQGTAEVLPFADGTFDAVLGTLVFCTIPDPAKALDEARRVLKAGGAFRIVEHVRVDNPLVSAVQDAATPLWSQLAGGCHLNRDTLSLVERAGFRVRAVRQHVGGFVIGIDANKP